MTRYLFALSVVILCSCGDDITNNTYIQEPSSLEMRTDFTEPCDPGEGALDTTGRLWICDKNGKWYRQEHFVDTIFKWQKDTVVITRKDTIILIEPDTTNNLQNLCGTVKYDSTTHFCDERDNRVYRWVKIGNQTWMADNLNYGEFTDDPNDRIGKKLCYGNDPENCDTLGGLYDFTMSTSTDGGGFLTYPRRGICPYGWHLPDSLEWAEFFRSIDTADFENDLGFNVVFSGTYYSTQCHTEDGFCSAGSSVYWEVSNNTASGSQVAVQYHMGNSIPSFTYRQPINVFYKSVRCLKD